MHFLGKSESKQAGVFVGAVKCAECPSAYGIWERPLCSSPCTAGTYLPSSDLLKNERQPASKTDGVLQLLKNWQKKKELLVISVYKQSNVTVNKAKLLSGKAVLQSLPLQYSGVAQLLGCILQRAPRKHCPWRMLHVYIFLSCTSNKKLWLFGLLFGGAEALLLFVCKGEAELSITF